MLELGGNAFDAAVATGLALQVVEPHLNGPGGDLPAILHFGDTGTTQVLCAQGTAPKAAHPGAFGTLDRIPGSGLLAAVVPGAFDGWMRMLQDHGTLPLATVMEPAITYAQDGHPLLPRVTATIGGLKTFFERHWPSSAALWLPGGTVPKAHDLFRNADLAKTYTRLAASEGPSRNAQIEAARQAWREGFVAGSIFEFLKDASVVDVSGQAHKALLAPQDMADWQASYEPTLTYDYEGWRIHKTQAWSQGPVLLQCLAILKHADLGAMDPFGDAFVHVVTEALKLALADREAYFGDPDVFDVPIAHLLSDAYTAARFAMIGETASLDQRPGRVPGLEHLADAYIERANRLSAGPLDASAGEPTMAHLSEKRGDTVHLDVIDRWGNMVAATPSGGWLQSSPAIPGLGFALGTRAQMFWLEQGLPSSLQPGARPRTTLSPSFAEKNGHKIAFGTPGGDSQDQWQLIWFLRFVHYGLGLQEGLDAPLFHTNHMQASFYPRLADPGALMIEPSFDQSVIDALVARGHKVTVAAPWSIGRLTAAMRQPDGTLVAGATPRLMQAYAMGR